MNQSQTAAKDCLSSEDIVAHGRIATDIASVDESSNTLMVNWALTNMCNYNCSYCFGHKKPNHDEFSSPKDLVHTARLLLELDRSQYRFALSGGEPTIHPGFFDLQDVLSQSNKPIRVHVITNASRGPSFFDQWTTRASGQDFSVSISLHTEHADIVKIHEILDILSSSGRDANISLMFNPAMKAAVARYHDYLCKLREKLTFRCKIVTLREGAGHARVDSRYGAKDFEWVDHCNETFAAIAKSTKRIPAKSQPKRTPFKLKNLYYIVQTKTGLTTIPANDGQKLFRGGLKNFSNFSCCTGLNLININSSGAFRGAVCSMVKYSKDSLFNMKSFSQNDLVNIVKCTLPGCGCVSNDNIPKFKYKEMALRYIQDKYINVDQ